MLQEASSVCPDISVLRRLCFAASTLPKDIPRYWELVTEFGFHSAAETPSIKDIQVLIENICFMERSALTPDSGLKNELFDHNGFEGHPLGIILISSNEICKICSGKLRVKADRPSFPTVYSDELGTVSGTHFRKYCSNHALGCSFTQHYGFHTSSGSDIVYDTDSLQLPFFLSSHSTAFQTKMLSSLSAEVLLGQISYRQRAEIYNYCHGYDSATKRASKHISSVTSAVANTNMFLDRKQLDRRRLEEGHIRYSIVDVMQRYPTAFPRQVISTDLEETMVMITPAFYEAFTAKYAAHRCSYPGCKNVMVIDGNMKNRRDVCAATEAGFIQYEGLSGALTTGCQLSPAFQSKFCIHHTPRVANMSSVDGESSSSKESIVGLITNKKETRNGTYYEVAWIGTKERVTWEIGSTLPQSLIDEFERNELYEPDILRDSRFGVTSHTLITSKITAAAPPPNKKGKYTQPVTDPGIFEETTESCLTCNTQKDKVRLHHRTAGILAGMRPCGIILLLAELFTSESKSQVYANLHEYLRKYPNVTENIKYICYDDGCHLRKYARNKLRSKQTQTAEKLASLEIVVDKMHMSGHIDQWCKSNCDPKLFDDLHNVDTEVCEQCFSWLSCYGKMTRKMKRSTFIFFLLYMCDLHNQREENKLKRGHYME